MLLRSSQESMVSHMLKLSSIISQVRLKNYLELLIQMVTELRLTAMVQMTYVKVLLSCIKKV